jgi:hypothetical protein
MISGASRVTTPKTKTNMARQRCCLPSLTSGTTFSNAAVRSQRTADTRGSFYLIITGQVAVMAVTTRCDEREASSAAPASLPRVPHPLWAGGVPLKAVASESPAAKHFWEIPSQGKNRGGGRCDRTPSAPLWTATPGQECERYRPEPCGQKLDKPRSSPHRNRGAINKRRCCENRPQSVES